MKTKFQQKLETVFSINGKSLSDAALLSARTLEAFRKEAAKQCIADILSIRAIRIEQEQKALNAQAVLLGMTPVDPAAPPAVGIFDKEDINILRAILAQAKEQQNTPISAVSTATVEVQPPASSPLESRGVEKEFNIASVFGVKCPKKMSIKIGNHNPTHPMVPLSNPDYVFRLREILNFICFLQMRERFLYMFGPTGCGKSSLIVEAASIFGVPLFDVTGHDRMESPELFGSYKLNNQGGMDWVDGPLVRAIKADGWFLLNEIDQIPPSTLVGLNGGPTETSQKTILIPETGELVTIGENFRFIATGNSNGCGDSTGLYQGVGRMNMAFMDRSIKHKIEYAEPAAEINILQKAVPSIATLVLERMVSYANAVRNQFVAGELEVTLSTRTLVRWARTASHYSDFFLGLKNSPDPMKTALDMAVGNMAEPDTHAALHELYQREFGGNP